ncbi:hypothetical protein PSHT_00056, partial [Puccinia striiformis]
IEAASFRRELTTSRETSMVGFALTTWGFNTSVGRAGGAGDLVGSQEREENHEEARAKHHQSLMTTGS